MRRHQLYLLYDIGLSYKWIWQKWKHLEENNVLFLIFISEMRIYFTECKTFMKLEFQVII